MPNDVDSNCPIGSRSSPDACVVFAILRAGDHFRTRLTRTLRAADLTLAQYDLLRVLADAEQPMAALCAAAGMMTEVPAITNLMERLERNGLISRCRCEADRRRSLIALTDAGRTRLASADELVRTEVSFLIGPMPIDQRADVVRWLGHLLRAHNGSNGSAREECEKIAKAANKLDRSSIRQSGI